MSAKPLGITLATITAASLVLATPAQADPDAELPKLLTLAEVQQAGAEPRIELQGDAYCFNAKGGAIMCYSGYDRGSTPNSKPSPREVIFYVYPSAADAQTAFAKTVNDRIDPPTTKVEPGAPKPPKPKVVSKSDTRITVTDGDFGATTDGLFGNVIVAVDCRTLVPAKKKAARTKGRKALVRCANSVFDAQAQKLGVS